MFLHQLYFVAKQVFSLSTVEFIHLLLLRFYPWLIK
jgi:hypothetical protein